MLRIAWLRRTLSHSHKRKLYIKPNMMSIYFLICNPKWWVSFFFIFTLLRILYSITWHDTLTSNLHFSKTFKKKRCCNLFLQCLDELIYDWHALTCIMNSLTRNFWGDSNEHLWRHQTQMGQHFVIMMNCEEFKILL